MNTQKSVNQLVYDIVSCAIEVHRHLGPGLLESIYELCLIEELKISGFKVESQLEIPVFYKGKKLDSTYRVDILVNDLVIVELKSVDTLRPVYKAQLLTYLKLLKKPKGIIINFNVESITKYVVPMVTAEFAMLPKE
jgi:GxxExxY protein